MAFLTALTDIGTFLAVTAAIAVLLHRKCQAYWIVNIAAATAGSTAFLTIPPHSGAATPLIPSLPLRSSRYAWRWQRWSEQLSAPCADLGSIKPPSESWLTVQPSIAVFRVVRPSQVSTKGYRVPRFGLTTRSTGPCPAGALRRPLARPVS